MATQVLDPTLHSATNHNALLRDDGSRFMAESRRRFPLFELKWMTVAKGRQTKFELTLGPTLGILFLVFLLMVTHHRDLAFLGLITRLLSHYGSPKAMERNSPF